MKFSAFAYPARRGLRSIFGRETRPIPGTIILTDRRNLICRHCAVNNITGVMRPNTPRDNLPQVHIKETYGFTDESDADVADQVPAPLPL